MRLYTWLNFLNYKSKNDIKLLLKYQNENKKDKVLFYDSPQYLRATKYNKYSLYMVSVTDKEIIITLENLNKKEKKEGFKWLKN